MACAMVPHMPNLPNGRETLTSPRSPLRSWLRRLSLHTLVQTAALMFKTVYAAGVQCELRSTGRLGSSGMYCPLRIHTPYMYMNPYETRSAWCAVPWRSPRQRSSIQYLYCFPKNQNYFPWIKCVFPRSVHVHPKIWNFEDLTRGQAFPKINLYGRFKFGRRALFLEIKLDK
jgi:hypothetical protein